MATPLTPLITILLITSATLFLLPSSTSAVNLWPYHHVHIKNALSNPEAVLLVHCKSKDDDLGVHSVAANDEFQWRFKRAFLVKETLFWCYLAPSSGGSSRHAAFDAYSYDLHDREVSNNLYWKATDDGVYLSIPTKNGRFQDFLLHPWQSGR